MNKVMVSAALAVSLLSGCASVPMDTPENTAQAKQFNAPAEGHSGLYIYRDSMFGAALKKDIWVNGECIGESAPKIFFYTEVEGDKQHQVSTESEFSPNDLLIKTDSGKNYFVKQYIKMGAFVGGADLVVVDEMTGKNAVALLDMAKTGTCSK